MVRRGSSRKKGLGSGTITGIVSFVIISGLAFYVNYTKPKVFENINADGIAGGFASVFKGPKTWVVNSQNYISSFFTNAEEVRTLRQENLALLEWKSQAHAIAERLETYEKLNNIKSEVTIGTVSGRLIAETSGPFSKTGIINIGSNSGIGTNWIVINQNGFVGRVISVSKNSSRILLATDNDSRISVMGENTRSRAMMIGDTSVAPVLQHLNFPPTMKNGEFLVTSGDDGFIPRGISVGTAGKAPDGKWRVILATNKSAIDFVKIIRPNNIPAPIDKVTMPEFGTVEVIEPTQSDVVLNPSAGVLTTAVTPEAIAQAQKIKRLEIERDKALVLAKKVQESQNKKAEAKSKSETKQIVPLGNEPIAVPLKPEAPAQNPVQENTTP